MSRVKRSFAKTDANATLLTTRPTKSAKGSGASNVPTATASGTTECPIKFICVHRPFWDFRLKHKGENDEDEGVDSPREKEWAEVLKEARKTWRKPAAEFRGYTWTVCWTYYSI